MLYFVRSDHIDRPVFATNTLGLKVWEASYLPFGGVHTSSGTAINLRFPGQWFQSEAGLHQNWMPDYDPTTGRYVQGDPLGLVDGASVYGYALHNPGRYTDPTGEFVPIVIFGIRIAVSSYGAYRRAIAVRAAVKVGTGASVAGAGSGPSAPKPPSEDGCEDDDACREAIRDALNKYNRLNDRIIEYIRAKRHGHADANHRETINQRQKPLRKALNRVARLCKKMPPDYEKWKRAAYQKGF